MKLAAAPLAESVTAVKPGVVQRKCACHGTCDSCREEKEKERVPGTVQRRASPAGGGAASQLSSAVAHRIQATARQGGDTLPAGTRSAFEPRFGGHDFSGTKVHTGAAADRLARDLGAEAFTVGNHMFFAANRYEPASPAGHKLLAHELTHVVQQARGGGAAPQTKLELGAPDSAAEREADRVAEAVAAGAAAGPITAFGAETVRRVASVPCLTPTDTESVCDDRTTLPCCSPLRGGGRRVVLPTNVPLKLSRDKARDAPDLNALLTRYKNAAGAKALSSRHAGRSTNTEGLWGLWAAVRGPAATEIMNQRGPHAALRRACSPDHIIELQVGGADNGNNLRLLERTRNERAGRELNQQLRTLNTTFLGAAYPENAFVEFTEVVVEGGALKEDDVCLVGEQTIPQGAAAPGETPLQFTVGGNPVRITYGASGEISRTHRYAVPGLELQSVASGATPPTLVANVSDRIRRMPFLKGHTYPDFQLVVIDGVLHLAPTAPPDVRLVFPFLSEAAIVPRFENGQWVAIGDFTPTLPLLRFAQVHLEIRNQQLQGGLAVPPDRLRQALPIPGLTLDLVNLVIGIANDQFSATGGFGFRYGTLASGQVAAAFTGGRFTADGTIDFNVPGLDQARGEAHVRDGRFSARVTLGKDKIRFPGVKSARVVVDVADGLLAGTGTVVLGIPGLDDASLAFTANSQGQYALSGTASGRIPGLRDPRITITYADGALSGVGHAGFAIPGLEGGAIDLRYAAGQFSGTASIDYRRGRLSGRVTLNLSPAHKLSGGGQLQYEIAPGLVAIVGLEVPETGRPRVSGELRLPDPIVIFPERSFNKRLFGISIDIPIFGISFGRSSIGIIANIAAGIDARAGIGPGQIRRPRIIAAFDPNDERGAASFQASAELYVPASAEIVVFLSGGIGVSLLIVKALGGIQANASAGLMGALVVPIELKYQAGKFTVDGSAELFAQPRLRFQLDAFVKVQADLLITTIDVYTKNWKLAAFEWGSDFRIGVRFPVHYVFGEPFSLSLSQLEFIAPQIDTRKLMRDLLPK